MFKSTQKIDGVVVKTKINIEQWKELYLFNKPLYRSNLKHYDDRFFARFSLYQDEDGDEADPMEHQADTESFYTKMIDTKSLMTRENKTNTREDV